ncbi:MAG: T9SS type A sorting domain-containing protein, partial [Calditrichaeota bacterium]|nr:T9SS type A sorting domain-containing protein [Calditrichota bacterium]
DYSTSGRQLPTTLDKLKLDDSVERLRYRIITEELNGTIRTDLKNNILEIDKDLILVKDFKLLQNYPNPFNPSTTISFDVPYQSRVTIQIYNILGQLVKTLVDNRLYDAGKSYKIIWDGTNNASRKAASGMYIYRFINEESNTIQIKKMILLK